MIVHHPPYDLIVDYATGSAREPLALAVASHAEWCADCRAQIAEIERVGGGLLEYLEPVELSPNALDSVMARLDEPEEVSSAALEMAADEDAESLPAALRRYLTGGLQALPWKRVSRLFEEARLPLSVAGYKASLMRLAPGATMPRHTHRGSEYTLVLAGGFTDGGRQYGPGDFSAKDPSDVHEPVVDPGEDCLCLVILDAPVKLTGAIGRIVNPFLRI